MNAFLNKYKTLKNIQVLNMEKHTHTVWLYTTYNILKIAGKKEQISDISIMYELKTNKQRNKEDRQHTVKNDSQIVYKCLNL